VRTHLQTFTHWFQPLLMASPGVQRSWTNKPGLKDPQVCDQPAQQMRPDAEGVRPGDTADVGSHAPSQRLLPDPRPGMEGRLTPRRPVAINRVQLTAW
jgi:hypothetical protein